MNIINDDNFAFKEKKDIGKLELLKILFKKILSDNKIDVAEKSLFVKFKTAFDINDTIYSSILAETIEEIKQNGNIFSGESAPDANGREYKTTIYREAYYQMLCNGVISAGENQLLTILGKVLQLGEDAEYDAVVSAGSMIIIEVDRFIKAGNYNYALILLNSFKPDKPNYREYFKTAYLLCKKRGGNSAGEFESNFIKKYFIANIPWEALYYHARLIDTGDGYEKKIEYLNVSFEAAETNEEKHLSLFQIAFCYHIGNEYEKALRIYNDAEKYDDSDSDTAANIISCFLSLKMYKNALEYIDKKIDRFNHNAYFLNNCAIVFLKNGDKNKAIDFFKKSIEIDPYYKDAQVNLQKLGV